MVCTIFDIDDKPDWIPLVILEEQLIDEKEIYNFKEESWRLLAGEGWLTIWIKTIFQTEVLNRGESKKHQRSPRLNALREGNLNAEVHTGLSSSRAAERCASRGFPWMGQRRAL